MASSGVSSSSSVMPITPFIGVRISWLMLARNSLFALFAALGHLGRSRWRDDGVRQSAFARCQLVRARRDALLQFVLRPLQLRVARLDLPEHVVEGGDQLPDLVVAVGLHAQAVVAFARDVGRGLGQRDGSARK